MEAFKRAGRFILEHRYGAALFALLGAGAVTGVGCVLFMRGFEFVFERRVDAAGFGPLALVTTPALFVAAVALVRGAAPFAAGTGIPQAVFAAEHMSASREEEMRPLVSPTTMIVKVAALFIGVFAGASTGREGPTVHVAVCLFLACILPLRRLLGLKVDGRAAVIAGAAAGLAAAFNTPLAGVAFAVEELAVEPFGGIKDYVVMSIVAAGLTARSMTGEYAYFGRVAGPASVPLLGLVIVAVVAGLLGALFGWVLLAGQRSLRPYMIGRRGFAVTFLLALGLAVLTWATGASVAGPGNAPAQELLAGRFSPSLYSFPATKAAATLLTYWSGIAGGIFAPCLGMGAAVGAVVARFLDLPLAVAALVGMAAFLSGAIQAPITSFVIIFEMTGRHEHLLPIMLAALIAYMGARLIGAPHLYETLASWYEPMFPSLKGRPDVASTSSSSL